MKNISLKVRLISTFLVLLIISTGALLLTTQIEYSRQMIDELYDAEFNSLKARSLILDEGIRQYDELSVQLFSDKDIRQVLRLNAYDAQKEYARNLSMIKDKLKRTTSYMYSSDITSVVIASPHKIYTFFDLGGDITSYENDFYYRLKEEKGRLVIFDTAAYPHVRKPNISTFAIGRLIVGDDMKEVGYEVIFVTVDFFERMIRNQDVNAESSYYIVADDGGMMYSRVNEKLKVDDAVLTEQIRKNDTSYFLTEMNGQSLLVSQYHSGYTDWTHVSVIALNDIILGIKKTIWRSIWIFLFIITIGIFMIQLIVKSITRPLSDMRDVMMQISDGDISLRVPDYPIPDLRNLSKYFNIMLDRIILLMNENQKKQEELKQVEFQMLQAQINPHFLYNSLNSVRWLAIFNGQEQIKQQIDNLTALLRSAISDSRMEVLLKEEMHVLRCYGEIMRLRYYNFKLETDFGEGTENCLVPKFILQPIVENAVLHGLSDSTDGGCIRVRSVKNGRILTVSVEDNGKGMTEGQIEDCMHRDNGNRFNHIGIMNVNQRIQLMYGGKYGIAIHSVPGQGTEVSISFPVKEEENG